MEQKVVILKNVLVIFVLVITINNAQTSKNAIDVIHMNLCTRLMPYDIFICIQNCKRQVHSKIIQISTECSTEQGQSYWFDNKNTVNENRTISLKSHKA